MKHVQTFAAICLLSTLSACGGSSHSNPGTATVGAGSIRIEAAILPGGAAPIDETDPSTGCPFIYQLIDPTNLEAGDVWQFQLASYDSNGNRTVYNSSGWTSSDSASLYGTLTYDSGVFTATGAQTQKPQTIAVTFNGHSYFATYDVLAHQARVRGQLLAHDTGAPIAGVEIDFYGPDSLTDLTTLVIRGKVLTQSDGTFQGSVPARTTLGGQPFDAVTSLQINSATVPSAYQQYYQYNGIVYQTGTLSCAAPLQYPGTTTSIADNTMGTTGLVVGNNDLVGVTQCTSSGTPKTKDGVLLLYSANETTPTANGCTAG